MISKTSCFLILENKKNCLKKIIAKQEGLNRSLVVFLPFNRWLLSNPCYASINERSTTTTIKRTIIRWCYNYNLVVWRQWWAATFFFWILFGKTETERKWSLRGRKWRWIWVPLQGGIMWCFHFLQEDRL